MSPVPGAQRFPTQRRQRRAGWFFVPSLLAAFLFVEVGIAAAGTVAVNVDLSAQTMRVSVGGRPTYVWKVSTARRGYRTPTGRFRPIRLERTWYSTIYHHSPMPYSIFFRGGYAIHGTYETRNLGRPVSHGCVRLDPNNAKTLFYLVQKNGRANTSITIVP